MTHIRYMYRYQLYTRGILLRPWRSESRVACRMPAPPALPACHLCGRQFGTSSLGIHLKACKERWEREHGRPAPEPSAPIPVGAKAGGKEWAKFNATAMETFETETMEACPHCLRTFLPDRLQVHLRTCGKGNFANPAPRPKLGGARGGGVAAGECAGSGATDEAGDDQVNGVVGSTASLLQEMRAAKARVKQLSGGGSEGSGDDGSGGGRCTKHATTPTEQKRDVPSPSKTGMAKSVSGHATGEESEPRVVPKRVDFAPPPQSATPVAAHSLPLSAPPTGVELSSPSLGATRSQAPAQQQARPTEAPTRAEEAGRSSELRMWIEAVVSSALRCGASRAGGDPLPSAGADTAMPPFLRGLSRSELAAQLAEANLTGLLETLWAGSQSLCAVDTTTAPVASPDA